jgi:methionyl aminopeptidase
MIKSDKEIKLIREGGRILAQITQDLLKLVEPGASTKIFDKKARKLIEKVGAKSAFLGYKGYPAAVCTSINEEIVHSPPGERKLSSGDIFSLDIAIKYPAGAKGLITDMALTVPVGKIDKEAQALIQVTRGALEKAIKSLAPGSSTAQLGKIIQDFVENQGFYVIKRLVGHGVGRELHEPPPVPNFSFKGHGVVLKPGMTLAIEPMVAVGNSDAKLASDGLTYKTEDGSLAAHFEHTVLITEQGAEILTMNK